MKRREEGLTIVELLVAGLIFVLLLGLISSALQSSTGTLGRVVAEGELIDDIRNAGQIISDSIEKAVYIYPHGTKLTINKSAGVFNTVPGTSSHSWQIGKDPIIAMILAPQNPLLESSQCQAGNTDACLKFRAYYAVERSKVVDGEKKFSAYLEDPNNENAWMLFEYRRNLDIAELNNIDPQNFPPLEVARGQAYMVADYLKSKTGFIPFENAVCLTGSGRDESDCSSLGPNSQTLHYRESVVSGRFRLEAYLERGNRVTQTPILSFSINPRNLYQE